MTNGTDEDTAAGGGGGTLTLRETARLLGIAATTIYELARDGAPPFRKPDDPDEAWIPLYQVGKHKRALRSDVNLYLAGRSAARTATG